MDKNKVAGRRKLKKILSRHKSRGEKIVFTNGCFDILHIGHIRYLKKARKLGDILVIGLNSDRSVSRIKPGRPVIPEKQRAEVLSALHMVNYITLFDEETPYELIRELKPDVLVKGADWKKKKIIGSSLVSDVRTLPFVRGISTTGIIGRIQRRLERRAVK